jgi:hypothetical protein
MAIITSYEVISKRRGKWEVESVTRDKAEAIERATDTLGTGHYQAVKVIGEKLDDETGETTSFTVFNKIEQRLGTSTDEKVTERRKPVERRKKSDRRNRARRKKKSGGFVDFLVKLCLFLWAMIASIAFMICYVGTQ